MKIGGIEVSEDVYNANPQLRDIAEVKAQPASKYKNVRQEAKGLRFASGHEAGVCSGLMLAEGQTVFGLRFQVRFPLPGGNEYVADATGLELVDGLLIPRVWDAKGYETPVWKIKRKLFKETYGIDIVTL